MPEVGEGDALAGLDAHVADAGTAVPAGGARRMIEPDATWRLV